MVRQIVFEDVLGNVISQFGDAECVDIQKTTIELAPNEKIFGVKGKTHHCNSHQIVQFQFIIIRVGVIFEPNENKWHSEHILNIPKES